MDLTNDVSFNTFVPLTLEISTMNASTKESLEDSVFQNETAMMKPRQVNPELLAMRLQQMSKNKKRSSLFRSSANQIDATLSKIYSEQDTVGVLKNIRESIFKKPDDPFQADNQEDTLPFAPPTPKATLFRGCGFMDSMEKLKNERQKPQRCSADSSEVTFARLDISAVFHDSVISEATLPTESTFNRTNHKRFIEPTEADDSQTILKKLSTEGDETKLFSFEDKLEASSSASSLLNESKSLLNQSGISEGNSSRFIFSSYGCCIRSLTCAESSLMATLTESVNQMKALAKHLANDFPEIAQLCSKLEPAFLVYEMRPLLPLIQNICEIKLIDLFFEAANKKKSNEKTNHILLCLAEKSKQTLKDAEELLMKMELEFPKNKFIDQVNDAMKRDQKTIPEKKVEYLKKLKGIRERNEVIAKCLMVRRKEFKQEIEQRKHELQKQMDQDTKIFEESLASIALNFRKIAGNNN